MESVSLQDGAVYVLLWILVGGFCGVKVLRTGRHLLSGGTMDEWSHEYQRWLLYINQANLLKRRQQQDVITEEQMITIGRIDVVVAWVLLASVAVSCVLLCRLTYW